VNRKLHISKPHIHIGEAGEAVVAIGYFTAALFFHGHAAELMAASYGTSAALKAREARHHIVTPTQESK